MFCFPEAEHTKELFDLAFDKRIAMTNDLVVVEATAVSALPKNQQIFGSPKLTLNLIINP